MKRFVGLVVALSLVPAGTAGATGWGSNDLKVVDNQLFTLADGPGFTVGLTQFGLYTHIDEDRFGIPEAGYPDRARASQTLPPTVPADPCARTAPTASPPPPCSRRSSAARPPPRGPHRTRPRSEPVPEHLHLRRDARRDRDQRDRRDVPPDDVRPRARGADEKRSPRSTRSTPTSSTRAAASVTARRSWAGSRWTCARARPSTRSSTRAPATRRRRCSARRA